jgi:hypothetical protein
MAMLGATGGPGFNIGDFVTSQAALQMIMSGNVTAQSLKTLAWCWLYSNVTKYAPRAMAIATEWLQPKVPERMSNLGARLQETAAAAAGPRTAHAHITFERVISTDERKVKPDQKAESIISFVCALGFVRSLLYTGADYMPDFQDEIEIDTDVHFKLLGFAQAGGSDATRGAEVMRFVIASYDHDITHLHKFVDNAITTYERRIKNKLGNHCYFFDQILERGRGQFQNPLPTDFLSYTKNKFQTNRTFDNVFFESRDIVRRRVEFFMNNRTWYDKKGIPYTLGFMFHGPPGTGKTSTIKAIANVTKRHIFNIALADIKTNKQLKSLFFSDEVVVLENGRQEVLHIPVQERVFVIEDIDCTKSVALRRKPGQPQDGDGEGEDGAEAFERQMQAVNRRPDLAGNMPGASGGKPAKPTDAIDLGTLLNVLDGTLEVPGRIIIVTTNFPERIDQALIRPGRIDMTVEFLKCNCAVLREMVEAFFDVALDANVFGNDEAAALDYKWTPAEVQQILFRNFGNPDAAIEQLRTESPQRLFKYSHVAQQEQGQEPRVIRPYFPGPASASAGAAGGEATDIAYLDGVSAGTDSF